VDWSDLFSTGLCSRSSRVRELLSRPLGRLQFMNVDTEPRYKLKRRQINNSKGGTPTTLVDLSHASQRVSGGDKTLLVDGNTALQAFTAEELG
jgi:hypothetical protein